MKDNSSVLFSGCFFGIESGTEMFVSCRQCGHSTLRVSPLANPLASNSIWPSQCWQRQVTKRDCLSDSLLMAFSSRIKNSNAKCPKRPSQNEHRKRAVQVRNAPIFSLLRRGKECGVRPNLISTFAQHRAPSHAPRCTGGMRNAHAVRVFSAPVQSNWVRRQNFLPAVHQALPDRIRAGGSARPGSGR